MPGKIISLVNFKGGVGKTTLTVNVAACLAKEHDNKVLLVDLDPQSNSSIWLLGPALWSELNSAEGFAKTSAALFYRTWTEDIFIRPYMEAAGNFLPRFYLSPGSLRMLRLEQDILRTVVHRRVNGSYSPGDEYFFFARAARLLKNHFDFVLIDCPPNLYYGTCNALCHSDYILIPCIPDTLSTCGLKQMIVEMERTIAPLIESRRLLRAPLILGVAITKLKGVNEHIFGLEVIESIISEFRTGDHLLVDRQTVVFRDQPVGEYVIHAEAVQGGVPLGFYAPRVQAYSQVKAFTAAMLDAMESRE